MASTLSTSPNGSLEEIAQNEDKNTNMDIFCALKEWV